MLSSIKKIGVFQTSTALEAIEKILETVSKKLPLDFAFLNVHKSFPRLQYPAAVQILLAEVDDGKYASLATAWHYNG